MNAMKPATLLLKALTALALGLALAAPAAAQSLNETVRRVERETGGRILSAETVVAGNREVHRIKVLTPDGRVRVVQEPAAATSAPPRSRETPRRDGALERFERQDGGREAEFAPRERGYVPRREQAREPPPPRGETRPEREPPARERRGRRDE
jgi:hypothetical protein